MFDRYNIVLWIFKLYAKTVEARLQISLAEIPYIRSVPSRGSISERRAFQASVESFGQALRENDSRSPARRARIELYIQRVCPTIRAGMLPTPNWFSQDKYEVLRLREHTLRKKIKEAVDAKKTDLEKRIVKGPSKTALVAVIGYTNAGKTTFIKKFVIKVDPPSRTCHCRLTGATSIFGENRLFATLDTTAHEAMLPSRNRVVFADTIGFISNLPIGLFASFSATLSHVVNAVRLSTTCAKPCDWL